MPRRNAQAQPESGANEARATPCSKNAPSDRILSTTDGQDSVHFNRALGRTLALARENAGLSQVDLARQSGLTRTSISAWEHGVSSMPVSALVDLSEALGLCECALIGAARGAAGGAS